MRDRGTELRPKSDIRNHLGLLFHLIVLLWRFLGSAFEDLNCRLPPYPPDIFKVGSGYLNSGPLAYETKALTTELFLQVTSCNIFMCAAITLLNCCEIVLRLKELGGGRFICLELQR